MNNLPFKNQNIKAIYDGFSPDVKKATLLVRDWVFEIAAIDKEIGEIAEDLKWNEPAYLTNQTNSGTTLRINQKKNAPNTFAIYVNCKTDLIENFKSIFPNLKYEGTRAIVFDASSPLPENEVKTIISMVLRYKLRGKTNG